MAVGTGGALGAIAPPFPQKRFETQLSNKYNNALSNNDSLQMRLCAFDTTRIELSATCTVSL